MTGPERPSRRGDEVADDVGALKEELHGAGAVGPVFVCRGADEIAVLSAALQALRELDGQGQQ